MTSTSLTPGQVEEIQRQARLSGGTVGFRSTRPYAIIGIDPGKSKHSPGAAVLLTDHFSIEVYEYQDDYTSGVWARAMLKEYNIKRIFIEQLNSQPTWPGSTNFSLGGSYHGWKQMWAFAQVPVTIVRPLKWQKGLFSKEDRAQGKDPKQKSVFYVRREYPGFAPMLAKNLKDHGKCDAFLIARWGKQQQEIV